MAVQIILKNSSIEDKRPSASQLTNGEISLNYNENGAFLCCKDTDGKLQQVGGVKIDEDAPDAPVKQTQWFKPSTLTLSVFDGDKWLPIAGGGGGSGGGGGGAINQIIGNDGIDADTVAGIVTLDVELAGGDDGLEFKSSKLSATLASATDLGSVKVGDNITVVAGKISVAKADASTFGVVKVGDGLGIAGDGTLFADVPTTTTYRGSCDLSADPTGQLSPEPPEKGDAYINSADASTVDAGWTGITGSAKIGDLVIFDGTSWDLIPLGAGTAPVTSVNTKTGNVVLDYTDVGAASAAQGALADTALQPGDNISELNNDEGYIKAAEAPVLSVNGEVGAVVLDAADVGALAPGDNVSELANDAEYISKGDPVSDLDNDAEYISKGDPVSDLDNDAEYLSKGDNVSDLDNDAGYITLTDLPDIPEAQPPTIISDTAPTGDDAVAGNLWYNTNDGRIYIYYKDADSSQWVDASPDSQLEVVTSGPSFPLDPELNDLFFNTTEGRLYIYFDDGSSAQWVDAAPQGSADNGDGGGTNEYWNRAGGELFPLNTNDSLNIGAGKVQLSGVDGSINARGIIRTGSTGSSPGSQGAYLNPGDDTNKRANLIIYSQQETGSAIGVATAPDTLTNKTVRFQVETDGTVKTGADVSRGTDTTTLIDPVEGIKIGGVMPDDPAISLNAADGSAYFGENTIRVLAGNNTKAVSISTPDTAAKAVFGIFGATNSIQSRGKIELTSVDAAVLDNTYLLTAGTVSNPENTILKSDGSINAAGEASTRSLKVGNEAGAGLGNGAITIRNDSTSATSKAFKISRGSTSNADAHTFINCDGSSEFTGDMAIGTTGSFTPSTPAISLNADGNITAAGEVQVTDGTSSATLKPTGVLILYRNASGHIFRCESDEGTYTRKFIIKTDGTVDIGGNLDETDMANYSPNITLSADGSITTVGNVRSGNFSTLSPSVGVNVNKAGWIGVSTEGVTPDRAMWQAYFDGVQTSVIRASGAAEFSGAVLSNKYFDADNRGNTTIPALQKGRWVMNPGGATNVGTYTDTSTGTSVEVIKFKRTGAAVFAGTVTSNGKVLTRNVELRLEADDDTKYTATTNAEGETELVYNGAVLDVKDRLQKADAALLALKKAAIAATDFASLKTAIVTALADI